MAQVNIGRDSAVAAGIAVAVGGAALTAWRLFTKGELQVFRNIGFTAIHDRTVKIEEWGEFEFEGRVRATNEDGSEAVDADGRPVYRVLREKAEGVKIKDREGKEVLVRKSDMTRVGLDTWRVTV